jgi:hypothetical protein
LTEGEKARKKGAWRRQKLELLIRNARLLLRSVVRREDAQAQ